MCKGAAIGWLSRRQTCATLSTSDAVYQCPSCHSVLPVDTQYLAEVCYSYETSANTLLSWDSMFEDVVSTTFTMKANISSRGGSGSVMLCSTTIKHPQKPKNDRIYSWRTRQHAGVVLVQVRHECERTAGIGSLRLFCTRARSSDELRSFLICRLPP